MKQFVMINKYLKRLISFYQCYYIDKKKQRNCQSYLDISLVKRQVGHYYFISLHCALHYWKNLENSVITVPNCKFVVFTINSSSNCFMSYFLDHDWTVFLSNSKSFLHLRLLSSNFFNIPILFPIKSSKQYFLCHIW